MTDSTPKKLPSSISKLVVGGHYITETGRKVTLVETMGTLVGPGADFGKPASFLTEDGELFAINGVNATNIGDDDDVVAPIDQMTVEKLSLISSSLLNLAAMTAAYPSWDDKFSRKEIQNVWSNAHSRWHQKFDIVITREDILSLSEEQRHRFGFSRWSGEIPIILIPLWVFNYLEDDMILTCIFGEKTKTKGGGEIDLDTRGGCIAWGILP